MKKICLLIVLTMLTTQPLFAHEGNPEKFEQCPGDFKVLVKVLDSQSGKDITTVSRDAKFIVDVPNVPAGVYYLYYFENGKYQQKFMRINFPFEFKRSYTGLFNGVYKLQFMVVETDKKCGFTEKTVTVTH